MKPPRVAGEGEGVFLTTKWSMIHRAGQLSEPHSRQALEDLCALYWRPLYGFIRRNGCDRDEAEDLTQGFFLEILSKNIVKQADPTRGRFRSFLLGCLKHYLSNRRTKERALKRGGGSIPLSLDFDAAERTYLKDSRKDRSPEQIYMRRWASEQLERVERAMSSEYTRAGKSALFKALSPYLGGDRPDRPLKDVAAQIQISDGAARTALHRMRRRFGELLRAEIAQTVATEDDIDRELQELLAIFEK